MPRNPDKTKCTHPGCSNWAKRGYRLCAEHLRQLIEQRDLNNSPNPLSGILLSLSQIDLPQTDLEIIDAELAKLYKARELFLQWTQDQHDRPGQPVTAPAKFMRAWNDSCAHVIKLIEARQRLGGKPDKLPDLLDDVQNELSKDLP